MPAAPDNPRPPRCATRRACEAAIRFGLTLDDARLDPRPDPSPVANDIADALRAAPGAVLLQGPSGAGKSTLLRALRRALRERRIGAIDAPSIALPPKPLVELLGHDAPSAMRSLAAVGLAEARLFLRSPATLSEGERARLRMAVAIDRAARSTPCAILADEFLSVVDRPAARAAARGVARALAGAPGVSLIAASAHDDLAGALAPCLAVRIEPSGAASLAQHDRPAPGPDIRIGPGAIDDYRALAQHHYRPGPPRGAVRTIAARDEDGRLLGVLVVAAPLLNGPWRAVVWPGRFEQPDPCARARAVNRDIRRIARVIVRPSARSTGVGTSLVRAYLASPDTPLTEAIAAMGSLSPFLAAAGMTGRDLPPSRRDARLLDALHHAGVEPWMLAEPSHALVRAAARRGPAFLANELRLWADAAPATRRAAAATPQAALRLAARSIGAPSLVYTHSAE